MWMWMGWFGHDSASQASRGRMLRSSSIKSRLYNIPLEPYERNQKFDGYSQFVRLNTTFRSTCHAGSHPSFHFGQLGKANYPAYWNLKRPFESFLASPMNPAPPVFTLIFEDIMD